MQFLLLLPGSTRLLPWLVSFPFDYSPVPILARGTIKCLSEVIDTIVHSG